MLMRWLRRRNRPPKAARAAPQAEWLEPRLLYSADAGALLQALSTLAVAPEERQLDAAGEYLATAPLEASEVRSAYALIPLQFEENAGQWGEGADFGTYGLGYSVRLGGGEAEFLLEGADQPVRLELVGSAGGAACGEGELATRSNYVQGTDAAGWATGLRNYASVLYRDVYDGVDIRYYGNQSRLEYDFIVAAGADAGQVQLRFQGIASVELAADGALLLRVAGTDRELRFEAPVSWQQGASGREAVASRYEIRADGSVGFVLGDYDHTRALVIDPVLNYASYLGGSGAENVPSVAVDESGYVYLTGRTTSTGVGTPMGGLHGPGGGSADIYVVKLDPDLGSLRWITRVGGGGDEQGNGIAVDSAGNVVVTGWTKSSDFPLLNAADGAISGSQDAVLFKLDGDGALLFSTYYGGSGNSDSGNAVGVDAGGNIYVAGQGSNMGLTGALFTLLGTSDNAFINKYTSAGAVVYQELFGGLQFDYATGLAVGAAGDVFVVGNTQSVNTTVNDGYQTSLEGAADGFLLRLDAGGANIYSTYIGAGDADSVTAVATDGTGRAYVVGNVRVRGGVTFTTTSGAFMESPLANNRDTGFLRIYDTNQDDLASLGYSSFLGGSATDRPGGVAYWDGQVVVAGHADSTTDFPTTADAHQATNSGSAMYLVVLDPAEAGAAELQYGTFYAAGFINVGGLALQNGRAYVAGDITQPGWATGGAYQEARAGNDAFVTVFSLFAAAPVADLNGATAGMDNTAAFLEQVPVLVAPSATLVDTDSANLVSLTVSLAARPDGDGVEALVLDAAAAAAASAAGLTVGYTAASGELAITGPATLASYQQILRGVLYSNSSDTPSTGSRSISVLASDGAQVSTARTATLSVTRLNDAPVRTAGTVANLTVFEGSGTTSLGLADLAYGPGGGADEAGQTLAYAVTAVPPAAVGQVLLANGSTVVAAGNSYTLAELQGMQFRALDGVVSGSGTFSFSVTDDGGTAGGGSNTLVETIMVAIVNQAPVLAGANAMQGVSEDFDFTGANPQLRGTAVADLIAGQASDPGGVHGIAVTAVDSANGNWEFTTNDGGSWQSLNAASTTASRLLAADTQTRVRFLPATNFNGAATLTFRAWDRTAGSAGATADTGANGGSTAFSETSANTSITVSPVNDEPARIAGALNPVTLVEGSGTVSLGLSSLAYGPGGGPDEAGQALTYTVTAVPAAALGQVLLADGTTVVGLGTYSIAQIQGMQFRQTPNGLPGSGSLAFRVEDDGSNTGGSDNRLNGQSVTITVTNQAPVLVAVNPVGTQLEDAASVAGTLVSDLATATDPGGVYGIAVIAADGTNGTWQYTTNGGGAWASLNGASAGSARLLAADGQTRIRFVPTANWNGTASIDFRAWDRNGAAPGALANITSSGGSTPYSAATGTSTVTVSAVNDTPVRTGGSLALVTVVEDSGTSSLGLGALNYGPGGGADEAAQTLGYTVTALPDGLGQVRLFDGTPVVLGATYSLGQIRSMRFATTVADAVGTGAFSFNVVDSGGGSGATLAQTLLIQVAAVNDPPVVAAGTLANLTVAEDSGSTPLGLAGMAYGQGGGPDETNQAISYTVTTVPPASLGQVQLANGTVVAAGSYTLTQLRGMRFVTAANAVGTGTFSFSVVDDGGGSNTLTQSLQITVTAVNDAPVRTGGVVADVLLAEDSGSSSLGLGGVAYSPGGGSDEAAQGLAYNVTLLPPAALGRITLADGSAVTAGSYSLAQIRGMRFVAEADASGIGSFGFSVVDSGGGSNTLAQTLQITVAAVNDAPVRTAGTVADLSVAEDGSAGLGLGAVAYGPGGGSDESGQVLSYAVTLLPAAGLGQVQLADGTAVTLGSYTLAQIRGMRFVAAADAVGTGAFSYSVVDDAGGANTLVESLQISVTPVNDAPVRAAGSVADLTVAEDAPAATLGLGGLGYAPGGGADEAGQVLGFTVTTLPPAALGQVQLSDGTAVTAGSYSLAQIRGMRFVAAAEASGTGTFAFTVADNGGGSDTLLESLQVSVTPVNDVPVRTAGTVIDLAVTEDSGVNSMGLSALAYAPGGGADEAGQQLTFTVTVLPPAALGEVQLSDGTAVTAGSYSLAQVRGMRFVTAADAAGTGTFSFSVSDDGAGNPTLVETLQVTVMAANDLPVRTAGSVAGLTVGEDSGSTALGFTGLAYAPGGGADEAGQQLTYTVTALPPATLGQVQLSDGTAVTPGTYSLAQLRTMKFTVAPDAVGVGTFSFSVSDDGGGSATLVQTMQIRINAANDAPVRTAGAVADLGVLEDSGSTSLGLAGLAYAPGGGSDEDDQVIAYTVVTLPPATLGRIVLADGTEVTVGSYSLVQIQGMRFETAANASGVGTFRFDVADDGDGNDTLAQSLQITVTAVDDATVAQADAQVVAEDTVASGNVLGNDSDVDSALAVASFQVDGDATTYLAGQSATVAGGTLTIAADGSYSFTPAADWFGDIPQVTYLTGTGVSSTLDVRMTAVDDPSVVQADTKTVAEDTAAAGNVLANDSDVDSALAVASFQVAGDATTYLAGQSATVAGGTLTIAANGAYTFTPAANWFGDIPQVSYLTNTGAASTLDVRVTSVDDATVAQADAKTVAEDTAATGNVLANDGDVDSALVVASFQVAGDATTYLAGQAAAVAGGTLVIAANGSYTFTPAANWFGDIPQVTYLTNTGAGSTLDVRVTSVDDPTVVVADARTVAEDTVATGNVLANDSDVETVLAVVSFQVAGDTTTYLAGQSAAVAGGTLTIAANGAYSFTPAANWFGDLPQVTYLTNTGAGGTLDVRVTAVDDPTVVVADAKTVAEDTVASGNVLANDSDVDNPLAVLSFQVAGDVTTYLAGQSATVAGGTLTIAANGSYNFTPAAHWFGDIPRVTYLTNTGASSTLDVRVTAVDDPALVQADAKTVAEDTAATGNVLANDGDVDNALAVASFQVAGDATSYLAGQSATVAGGTLTIAASGAYTFTPAANWFGDLPQVTYLTNSGASSTLDVRVTAVDDPTLVVADAKTVAEDTAASGNVLANDSDVETVLAVVSFQVTGDATTYLAGQAASVAGGTLTLGANGAYTFTPAANWFGDIPQVTYLTNTGAASTLDVRVTSVDDATVAQADAKTVAEDTAAMGNVLANDGDVDSALAVASFQVAGDATTYLAGQSATVAGGTLMIAANGSYTFTPAANWFGDIPQVTYLTNTGASSTLDVRVTAVDDATVVVADAKTVAEDTAATGNVLTNDSDVETALAVVSFQVAGDATTYLAGQAASVAGGTLTIAANGAYTFTPAANWSGDIPQVAYLTNTGAGSTLDVRVTAVDDPTIVQADARTIAEDGVASGNVLTNDSDVETALAVVSFQVAGDATTYLAGQSATVAGGTLVIAASGAYTFTPAANWFGDIPQVTYLTNTGAGSTLDVRVTAVDDPTVVQADARTVAEDNAAIGNVLTNDSDVETTLAVVSFQVAGDATTYLAGQSATVAGGTLVIAANGAYTFTPAANWFGDIPQVTYLTNTGAGSTLDVRVTSVDDATVAQADAKTVAEDTAATGNVLANDSDVETTLAVVSFQVAGDATTYLAGQSATVAGGTLTIAANGAYTFTPAANWFGDIPQVSYLTNTGAGSTLDVRVTSVDDATVVQADAKTVAEDTAATGNVLANDSDADDALAVLSFQVAGDATTYLAGQSATVAGGALVIAAGGAYTFTPAANWFGDIPQVTYLTSTGASSTLDVRVTAVDDPTILQADAHAVAEDTAATGNVLTNDSDVETTLAVVSFQVAGDATTYLAGQSATVAGGTLAIAANGAYTFTPAANWFGDIPQVTYFTNAGAGSTLDVRVTAVDDPTVVQADAQTVAEDGVASGNVLTNDSDVETTLAVVSFQVAGDATTYLAGQSATVAGGTLVIAANGAYTFTPAANWFGDVPQVSYLTNTGAGSTLDVRVTAVDDPAIVQADAKTVAEDTIATGNVLTNDSDVETLLAVVSFQVAGDATTYLAGQSATVAGGTLTIAANGAYTFTPAADWFGDIPQVTYLTNAGAGSTLDVRVTAVDDSAVVQADAQIVAEDTAATGNVLTNDSDVETVLAVVSFQVAGDATTYLAGQSATVAGGTLAIAADGAYTFTPAANWFGDIPRVTYLTNAGAGSTLDVRVTSVDDPTVVQADAQTVAEDTAATGNVLTNDSDVETALAVVSFQVAGDATTYLAGQSATVAGGTLVIAADGAYSFTPAANWFGDIPRVSYLTNTGAGSTLDVRVTSVDDPTIVQADAQTVAEDTAATGNVLANDSDADDALAVLSFQVAGDATTYLAGQAATVAGGTLTIAADGSYAFTPAANWFGDIPQVTYFTNAGAGSTLDVRVTAVDDPTVVQADAQTVAEDGVASGNVLTNDSDVETTLAVVSFQVAGDATTYLAGQSATVAGGTLVIAANGAYTFTPAANWFGDIPQVSYLTNTGAGSTLDVRVTSVDDATVVQADAKTVAEDTAATGNVLANDSDADDALAVLSFQVAGDAATYLAGQSATVAGGTLTIAADGSYAFTPAANWFGDIPQVSYLASTGVGSTLDVRVTSVDDPTIVQADARTLAEDTAATGNVLANDSDADDALAVLSFQVAGDATTYLAGQSAMVAGGTLVIAADGAYTFTPAANWSGDIPQVSYLTNTGAGSTLDVRVTSVDDATVAQADVQTVAEDTAAAGNVLANDSDVETALAVTSFQVAGDATTYLAGQAATVAGGTLTIAASGAYTFTPAANWFGDIPQVTYLTNTGAGSTLDVRVTSVDDPTIVQSDARTVAEDTAATGNVLANDSDVETALAVVSFQVAGDATTYLAGQSATVAGGTLAIAASGAYTFTPAANWSGDIPQVTYLTNTGAGSTLDVRVTAVDDPTVAQADANTVAEDTAATGNVLANDSDVETALAVVSFQVAGDATTYLAGQAASVAGGTLTIAANGAYTFTPAANWSGDIPQVAYLTNTGVGSTLDVRVSSVDDPTIVQADARTIAEDGVASGNVLTNDSDVETALAVVSFQVAGDATSYLAGQSATVAGGTLTIAANGAYTFTPAANWFGDLPQVTYLTNSGASSTLDVRVTAVDDPTIVQADARTVAEDNAATGNVLTNDSDVETALAVVSFQVAGDATTYLAGQSATVAGGTLTIAASGAYTYTPAANWSGDIPQVTYLTNTGAGSTLDVRVTAVDDPTIVQADANTVAEDTAATGNVLANDSDVETVLAVASFQVAGDTTTYLAGQSATVAGGTLTIAANGAYTFTPAANWFGDIPQVSYVTNTGAGSTLDVRVTAVDDPTVAQADARTTAEDTVATGNVLANDSDVETVLAVVSFQVAGDATTYLAGQSATVAGGTLTIAANGGYTFTPAANWFGDIPQVTYLANTGAGSTLDIRLTAVDDATVVQADAQTVAEESTATGNVLANDSDVETALSVLSFQVAGDATVYSAGQAVAIAGVGAFTLAADGAYTFTPLADWAGPAPLVTYLTNTGAASTLALTVTAVNDAPVRTGGSLAPVDVAEDSGSTSLGLAGLAYGPGGGTDEAGQGLAYAVTAVPPAALGRIVLADGSTVAAGSYTLAQIQGMRFVAAANAVGSATFSFTVSDGSAGLVQSLQLTVRPVNDAPVLTGGALADIDVVDGSPATSLGLAALAYGAGGGADEGGQSLVFRITAVPAAAFGDIVLADGVTVVAAGNGYQLAELRGMQFRPVVGAVGGPALFSFDVVDDGGTAGGGADTLASQSLRIHLVPNHAPVLAGANALPTQLEDAAAGNGMSVAALLAGQVSDVDQGALGGIAVVGAASANGSWQFSTDGGSTWSTFGAVSDGAARLLSADGQNRVRFVANADWNGADTGLVFRAWDRSGGTGAASVGDATTNGGASAYSAATATATATVLAVNDQPVRTGGATATLTVDEGSAPVSLGLGTVSYSVGGGADEAAAQALTFTITAVPGSALGAIVLADGTTVVSAGASYSLAQLQGMQFRAAAGASGGSATFSFDVADGGGVANGGSATLAQELTVAVRNLAPVLSGAQVLPALLEDARDNAGMTVAELVAGHVTDPTTERGIAVVQADSRDGRWEASQDGGTTWTSLADASDEASVLLADSARIRFVPAADWNGIAGGLRFRAWDQTGGSAALAAANTLVNGGSNAFSADIAEAFVSVQAVNDAPVRMGDAPADALAGSQAGLQSLGLERIAYGAGGGDDESSQSLLVTVTTLPPASMGTVWLADGATRVVAGGSYTLEQLRGMRFAAAGSGSEESARFAWTLQDDGGTDGGGADRMEEAIRVSVSAPASVAPPTLAPAPAVPTPVPAPAPAAAVPEAAPAPAPAVVADRPAADSGAGAGGGEESGAAGGLLDAMPEPMAFAPDSRLAAAQEATRTSGAAALELRAVQLVGFNPNAAEFTVTGFAGLERAGVRITVDELQQTLRSAAFLEQLDRAREKLRQEFNLDQTVSISVAGLSLGVSVAYVLWMVRGGVLLGSYLSALPAWRLLDPLPVLARASDEEDDEDEALDAEPDASPDPLRGFA